MTTGTGDSAAAADADSFASDWKELRADGDIQFAPVKMPEAPKPPDWLENFFDWLGSLMRPVMDLFVGAGRALGLSGQAVMWILVAVGVLLAIFLLLRTFAPLVLRRRAATEAPEPWAPDTHEALSLLEEADRLAAQGRYEEATHLLLRRSVGQIAAARPDLLDPSSTAREIAALPALSQAARGAFGAIAERVERSLFALRRLSADDWHAARAAYAEFALAGPQAA